jgi:hypothetical protein
MPKNIEECNALITDYLPFCSMSQLRAIPNQTERSKGEIQNFMGNWE